MKPEKSGKEEPAKQMMTDKEAYAGIKEYMIKVWQCDITLFSKIDLTHL